MRVLVVDGYDPQDEDAHVVASAIAALENNGNQVKRLSLAAADFDGYMSADERRAYETDEPLLTAATKTSASAVQQADALLFCYRTTLFGVPPRLKSWLERVMVMGVAFVFDDKQRVKPGLTNIKRLGVVTTSPHTRLETIRARDLGRRTFMRTLRLNCHPMCRRTFARVAVGTNADSASTHIHRRLANWT